MELLVSILSYGFVFIIGVTIGSLAHDKTISRELLRVSEELYKAKEAAVLSNATVSILTAELQVDERVRQGVARAMHE